MQLFVHISEWESGVSGYETSNENKIATCVRGGGDEPQVLYSTINSYVCGHSIVFKVLQDSRLSAEDGIALTADSDNKQSLLNRPKSLFVSSEGKHLSWIELCFWDMEFGVLI